MNNRRGYTNIEVVLVLLLLIAVSFLVFATVSAGSRAFFNLSERRERDADLRVALSYIDVRVRKSDAVLLHEDGKADPGIEVMEHPFADGSALLFRSQTGEYDMNTWVYCLDGTLFELFQLAGTAPDHALALPIANIDRLSCSMFDDLLRVTLEADADGNQEAVALSGTYMIRTEVTAR